MGIPGRSSFVVFRLEGGRYALPLSSVERVVRAVEVTGLPGAPASVIGVINVAGRVLPAFNLRRRFGLRQREIEPGDQILLARTARREVALVIDGAMDVVERPAGQVVAAREILPGSGLVEGVIKLDDGLVLIHDLERFLSADEARALDGAMEREAAGGA